jgi:CHAD domain-containing protein
VSAPSPGKLEREIKLEVQPGLALPDLTGVVPGVRVVADEDLHLDATYVDTTDLRLVREGVSLRRRTGEGTVRWTLKLPSAGDGTSLSRREFDVDVDDEGPEVPPPLAALVTGWVRTAPLVPVVVLRSHRRRLRLIDADERELAEIDDDEVTALEDGRETARFREVEVELAEHASSELLSSVSAALVAAGAGATEPIPKVARALGPRALAPPDLAGPVLDESSSVADVVAGAIRSSVASIVGADHAIRLGDEDGDGVRRARSAVRRLRSDLDTLGPLLDPTWAEGLRAGVAELGEALALVRRTDLLVERLLRSTGALPADERAHAARLVHQLEEQRAVDTVALLGLLNAERYVGLLDQLVAGAEAPRLADDGAAPAVEQVPALVERRWRRLHRAVDHLPAEASDEALLEVRSAARRARHAAELAVPLVGASAALLARGLGGLQEVLGTLHHARDAQAWLAEVLHALGTDERVAAESLAALQRADADQARSAWHDAWDACDTKAATRWLR